MITLHFLIPRKQVEGQRLRCVVGKMLQRLDKERAENSPAQHQMTDNLPTTDQGLGLSVHQQKLYQVLHRKIIKAFQQS